MARVLVRRSRLALSRRWLIPLGGTNDARLYYVRSAFQLIGEMAGGQDGKDAAEDILPR